MDAYDSSAVVRRTPKDAESSIGCITTRSTAWSIDDVGGAYCDDGALGVDEASVFLPDECVENHVTQLVNEFGRMGYDYCGEAMPTLSNPSHCTFHRVRSAMGHPCFAKVVDLHTGSAWQSNHHAVEGAIIAEYLSCCGVPDDQPAEAYKESCGTRPHASCTTVEPTSDDGSETFSPSEIRDGCATLVTANVDSAQADDGQNTQLGIFAGCTLGKEHIVSQYDWLVTDDQKLIMVYENCDGGDLHTLIAKARSNGPVHFDESFIEDVFTQICMGVEYFHSKNIVHGDIKASNVLFKGDRRPVVKVGDYDTCHVAGVRVSYTGTLMYTAPELIANPHASTSFESDVWALGCLLYELLTLTHPFASPCTVQSMKETFRDFEAHISELIASVPNTYSLVMRDILVAILDVNPTKRPTVGELISILCREKP
ncbi:MAPKK-RELATED SERINE/THREONINE PROTEIN KINASE, putative [Babesia bigemina]|uniref:non-specific serine/threonine protein kinase n=1 Tax=Babesia bigemina TaxID=5866 RepID=A0A061D2C1_BABBI|nr:MAPKK-RELATED SERINE/THREONINE PROTEIN KINASE, putative [Babesia bigemina]CDR94753.1 MAPKK-RELATED SERINE/THREONINE PROTEIN KINASE, putative [Babesia bigemina]|eukprot:XP_012766939.1 MAPKK-RELATED SERINE/THREONINE PROTEIN KINASE, putative [Babesia bigemina]